MCLEENEDDDHIIYCQQLRDKWLMVANNTRHECDQMLKDLLSQENHLQLNQEDIQLKSIVKSEKATLTITTLFLEIFINEFYRIIWQLCCNLVTEWEHTKGIKKQNLRKKIPVHQRITYEQTPT